MLSNPRRIAVVILASLVGFALQRWVGFPDGLAYGLLLGVVASFFVPTGGCRVR